MCTRTCACVWYIRFNIAVIILLQKISFNCHKDPMSWVLLSPFDRQGPQDLERIKNLSKVTQQINGKRGVQIKSLSVVKTCLFPTLPCCFPLVKGEAGIVLIPSRLLLPHSSAGAHWTTLYWETWLEVWATQVTPATS